MRFEMQHIPARGRKLRLELDIKLLAQDAAYPREGTETFFSPFYCPAYPDAAYPREGTET